MRFREGNVPTTHASHARRYAHAFAVASALTFALLFSAGEAQSNPVLTIDEERIDTPRTGTNGRSWQARFNAHMTQDHVYVTLRIKLIPGPGISRPQLERVRASWEATVEHIWRDRFALVVAGVARPIRVELQFGRPDPHYRVVLTNDVAAHANPLNWSRYSSARVIAHEVGHMLGAYDEYAGGGQHPDSPQNDPLSLMGGAINRDVRCRARHFELVTDWARTRVGDVEIKPVE